MARDYRWAAWPIAPPPRACGEVDLTSRLRLQLTIGSVMSSVIASVLLVGYDIDAGACVLIIMVIGMAIDYAVHMAHAYNEAHGGRQEKASEAVQGMGISVLSGAGTTIGAAVPLLFASFLFYVKMGWFIFFVALWGVIYSFTMLVPLMMICGPEGTQGDVTHLLRCRAVVKAEPKVVDETVGSTPPRTPANTLCLVTAPSASVEASNAASGGACSPGGAADEATEGAA